MREEPTMKSAFSRCGPTTISPSLVSVSPTTIES